MPSDRVREILPPDTAATWDAIAPIIPADVYLGGGTAIAVYLGHRISRDLDFFFHYGSVDLGELERRLSAAGPFAVTERARPDGHEAQGDRRPWRAPRLLRHPARPVRVAFRGRPATGWEALTPTEVKVAYLVADGQSNPGVAAALFLSRNTVQTHVSHILAKLGARSRAEIIREAVRHPATRHAATA